jgi:hypothetical protein
MTLQPFVRTEKENGKQAALAEFERKLTWKDDRVRNRNGIHEMVVGLYGSNRITMSDQECNSLHP